MSVAVVVAAEFSAPGLAATRNTCALLASTAKERDVLQKLQLDRAFSGRKGHPIYWGKVCGRTAKVKSTT